MKYTCLLLAVLLIATTPLYARGRNIHKTPNRDRGPLDGKPPEIKKAWVMRNGKSEMVEYYAR